VNAEERAARCARLHEYINHPDVKDAVAEVESDLIAEWRRCQDVTERDRLWHTLKALDRLTGKLVNWSTADLAAIRKGR
jgi:hypothetical protein